MIEGISTVMLGTHEMPRAVRFYCALGFEVLRGNEQSSFTSFRAGINYLNLIAQPTEPRWSWWGRVIFYIADVVMIFTNVRSRRGANQPPRPATPNGESVSSTPFAVLGVTPLRSAQLHPMRMRLPA